MDKKILIAEDDELLRALYEESFKAAGYEVLSADCAESALEILKTEPVKVMFLDLKLPGMDGVEMCRQLRRTNADAAIYAITGHTSIFEHAECLRAGFNDYFKKPVDLNVLLKAAEASFPVNEK